MRSYSITNTNTMKRKKGLVIYFTDKEHDELKRKADSLELSMNQFIRQRIKKYRG